MKLLKAVIKNFRNVVERAILLDKTYVVEGANMTGKTNTLNAIHWAFTGTTMDGSNDNRANFTITDPDVVVPSISVRLEFEGFTFERRCDLVLGVPTVSIYINDVLCKTVKNGEAQLHAKLGLSDIILKEPKGFDIVKFLLNPLYFETVAPKSLRQFFYLLADVNFDEIAEKQSKAVVEVLTRYPNRDPYFLLGSIDTEKRALKKTLDACKVAIPLFPEISGKAHELQTKTEKEMKEVESRETLIQKYALAVSKHINGYYQKAMKMGVCILEKGVDEDVFLDVCYPILPISNLPFSQGSYAEKTCMAVAFVSLVAKTYNIPTLPLLVDNMESLDSISNQSLNEFIEQNDAQYIGAMVQ